ncbi:hypothetical protein BOTNAR_0367g00110 [Botryotinia narcissicola]|uniref:Uncharacterized protein n=1 Tax=Botryotinia narcissicola TaxID=278944 RepID=A0A4Z1HVL2_9HELO|nr:hypothetical protein BOTNAR_0367g00110 [Botryotinia narcissicola]
MALAIRSLLPGSTDPVLQNHELLVIALSVNSVLGTPIIAFGVIFPTHLLRALSGPIVINIKTSLNVEP